MRRLRYNVAVSLDGFIARPNGTYDWIVEDNTIDFSALMGEFDAVVMGRRTYDVVRTPGSANPFGRNRLVVASRTLNPADYAGVTVIASNVEAYVAAMKREPGKDIWLFGGADLFRQLLSAQLVDTIEFALMPILIGEGIRVLPAGPDSPRLELTNSKPLPSGIVLLTYRVPEQKAELRQR
jgi:dihydrofolate reductase